MVSLCAFFVLLLIGYFFIDKKTQGELVNKCKKNKFIILGGLFVFYFFFLQNNVEGMVQNYNPEVYTSFINNICYGRGGMTSESLYLLNQRLVTDGFPKLSDTNPIQCLLDGMSHKSHIEPHLSQEGDSPAGSLYVTP
jgi:hypothetical protein